MAFLKVPKEEIVKTLIYKTEDKVIAVLIKGDREANESKIKKYLNYPEFLALGDEETVFKSTRAGVGFAGPIGINMDQVLVDEEVKEISNFIVGGNEIDYHYVNVNFQRYFIWELGDLQSIKKETCVLYVVLN